MKDAGERGNLSFGDQNKRQIHHFSVMCSSYLNFIYYPVVTKMVTFAASVRIVKYLMTKILR